LKIRFFCVRLNLIFFINLSKKADRGKPTLLPACCRQALFTMKINVQHQKLALEISVCSENYPRGLSDYPDGDKMFVENVSSVQKYDPSRGRTA